MIKVILAYLLAFVFLFFAMGGIDDLFTLVDIPSLLFVLIGFVLLFANFTVSEILNAFKDSFSKNINSEFKERYILGSFVIKTAGNYILYVAIIATIIGLVMILGNLAAMDKLAPSIALSMIAPFYAVLIKFVVLLPMSNSLDKKVILLEESQKGE